jgi:hypothetical protein
MRLHSKPRGGVPKKEHLQFVAQQPYLICGRRPMHAHHVRFAQRRALGMKVGDEFTAVHRIGDERRWWARQAIDPLATASGYDGGHQGAARAPSLPADRPAHVRFKC